MRDTAKPQLEVCRDANQVVMHVEAVLSMRLISIELYLE